MATIPVTIPADLWAEDVPAVISSWYYDEGDTVEEGAVIADLMVEKSTFELIAPATGRLGAMRAVEEQADRGETIATIEG